MKKDNFCIHTGITVMGKYAPPRRPPTLPKTHVIGSPFFSQTTVAAEKIPKATKVAMETNKTKVLPTRSCD